MHSLRNSCRTASGDRHKFKGKKFYFEVREASHVDFVHEKRHMDVGGGGGGRSWCLCCFSMKIIENFDGLFENFNILNSSIQSIQNPAFL